MGIAAQFVQSIMGAMLKSQLSFLVLTVCFCIAIYNPDTRTA
jgi:hypothetical protein